MAALTPAHRKAIRARKRRYFDLVRETIVELQAQGKLRDVDPTVAAFALFGMINWISRWYRPAGKLTAGEVMDDFLEIALNAVLRNA